MFLCMHVWLIVFPSSNMINSLQSSMILRIRKLHFHFLERSKSKLPACQVWAWFCRCGVCRWFLRVVWHTLFLKSKTNFYYWITFENANLALNLHFFTILTKYLILKYFHEDKHQTLIWPSNKHYDCGNAKRFVKS